MDLEASEEREAIQWVETWTADEIRTVLKRELTDWERVVCKEEGGKPSHAGI